jgi:hypothetical protein
VAAERAARRRCEVAGHEIAEELDVLEIVVHAAPGRSRRVQPPCGQLVGEERRRDAHLVQVRIGGELGRFGT